MSDKKIFNKIGKGQQTVISKIGELRNRHYNLRQISTIKNRHLVGII